MIKARIDKLDRDDETSEHVCDCSVGIDVGTKFVPAKKHVAAEERIAFALEIMIFRQPGNFVTVFLHPTRKMRRFAGALLVAKIARNKFLSDSEAGVGRENHVGQIGLRRDQLDFAIQLGQRGVQIFPLFLRNGCFSAAGATHPWVNLVLDAVMVRRAKEKLAHKVDNYFLRMTSAPCSRKRSIRSSSSDELGAEISIRAQLWSTRFWPILNSTILKVAPPVTI